MSRRELREQIFKLLFRVEFNSPEDSRSRRNCFLKMRKPLRKKMQNILQINMER